MKKRILSMLLAIVMVVGLIPSFTLTASAAENFYIVAGSPELFGAAWDPAFEENKLSLADDGNYYKTYNNVAVGTYLFKITTNGAWDNGEYNLEGDATFGGEDASVTVSQDGSTVIIGFDGTKALLEIIPPGGSAVNHVASVTTTGGETTNYTDIASAVAAAQASEGSTLKLLDNITIDTAVTINSGSFTIDLNGKTLTAAGEKSGVEVKGDLTVTDSSTAKSGKLSGTATKEISSGVCAYGSIIVSGGELTGRSIGGDSCGVYASGNITVIDGSLSGTGNSHGVYAAGNISVSGGELTGTSTGTNGYGVSAEHAIEVSENGILTATGDDRGVYSIDGGVTVSGGELTCNSNNYGIYIVWSSITVNGGEIIAQGNTSAFNAEPSIGNTLAVYDNDDNVVENPDWTILTYAHIKEKSVTQSVSIAAVDDTSGEEIAGANLQIIDSKGEVVEEWVSEAAAVHEIAGLKTGEVYVLRATVAPNGYTIAKDVTFSIDAVGNVSSTGTVSADGILLVEFSGTKVKASAVDIANGRAIAGAHLQILDAADDVVEEWVSAVDDTDTHDVDESVHTVTGLKTNVTYILRAAMAPAGYTIASDTIFVIHADGTLSTTGSLTEEGILLHMFEETEVRIVAFDSAAGEGIAGATMQILDESGNLVEEWVSAVDDEATEDVDESIKTITGLNTGETFTLHTTVAPDGYTVPADTTFGIDENGKITTTGSLTEDGILLAEFESAVTTYPLYVGMQQFTENLLTITDSNGGTATYDPQTHTLTLNNFTYSGTGKGYVNDRAAIFYHGKETLTLHLVGKSSITYSGNTSSNNYGFYAYQADVIFSGTGDLTCSGGEAEWFSGGIFVYHDLTLSGTGKLNVIGKNGGGSSQGIYCAGALTISDGTVNITTGEAQDSIGIRGTYGAISVDGGSLNITCGNASNINCGIYTVYGGFVCSDGTVTVTSGNAPDNSYGIYADESDFVLSGGTVTVTGGICGTDEGGYSCGIVAQNISVHDGHLTAVGSTAATSVGIYAFETATLYGGVLEAAGQTQALNMAPAVDSGFTNAAVWYGDNAATAGEAKPIGELADNYDQKYVKVAATEPDTYTVTVPETENGTVTADKATAAEGETVTITVTPDSGKEVDQVTVKDASGKDVLFTDNGDGTYSFEQPAGDVEIIVVLKAKTYTVTLVTNSGTIRDGDVTEYTYGVGTKLPTDVTRSGYRFGGWYDNEDCKGTAITEINTTDSGNKIFYAKWMYAGGGGGGGSTYSVTVEKSQNGTVSISPKSASKGSTVTVTVDPDKGYTLETLTVTDKNGKEIELTNKSDGRYTFKMPASKVTVTAAFMDDNTMLNFFVDVPTDTYYYDAVLWAAKQGITGGTSATTFSPDNPCTRAQMATFLWRAAGSPDPVGESNPFTDVREDAYYAKAVQWAYEQGITGGTSATTFSPDATCTRAQMATFIYRNEQANGGGFTGAWMFRLPFTDAPEWAFEAIAWCYKEGITAGTSTTTFSPDDPCTRAQMVTFLYRYFVK